MRLSERVEYRKLLCFLVWRDVKVRYRQNGPRGALYSCCNGAVPVGLGGGVGYFRRMEVVFRRSYLTRLYRPLAPGEVGAVPFKQRCREAAQDIGAMSCRVRALGTGASHVTRLSFHCAQGLQ